MGKVLIINSLCASLFVYKLAVLNMLPKQFVTQFNKIIHSFIWNNGKPKLALEKLFNSTELGGLKLVDISAKDAALKCQWISYLKQSPKLANLANQFLPSIGQDIWLCNFKMSDVSSFMSKGFWMDVVRSWAAVYYFKPTNASQMAAQSLWFNSNIKIQGSLVWYPKAYQSGMKFLYNIWNTHTTSFLQYDHVCQVYGTNAITYLQYYGLISTIPWEWVPEIKSTMNLLDDYIYPYENFIDKMSNIVYYKIVSDKHKLQKLCHTWCNKINLNLDYDDFLTNFQQLYYLTTSTKLRSFQFRFMHRIIFCNKILHEWKIIDSPRCSFCLDDYETIEHLFFRCTIVTRFWELFQAWFECLTDTEIEITEENVFFCNHQDDLFNILLLIAKQYIFARKCVDKLELSLATFKDKVMEIISIEHYSAFRTKRFKPFVKKWSRMFPV